MEKSYDIRNVYVGFIARQSEVTKCGYQQDLNGNFRKTFKWSYMPIDVALFTKNILGEYKSVSTGEKYVEANEKTGGQVVLVRNRIMQLSDYDSHYVQYLIAENNSYKARKSQLEHVEGLIKDEFIAQNKDFIQTR